MKSKWLCASFAAAVILAALIGYSAADDTDGWANSKFGPLNGLEENVYTASDMLANNTFMTAGKKMQPILSYCKNDGTRHTARMLPMNPQDMADDSALAISTASSGQDIDISTKKYPCYSAAVAGLRPVAASVDTLAEGGTTRLQLPSTVYMQVTGWREDGNNSAVQNNRHEILYTYISDDKTRATKHLYALNRVITKFDTGDGDDRPELQNFDCAAADLNGDGYSELIAAYPTAEDSEINNAAGNNTAPKSPRLMVEVIDGRALFEAADGAEMPGARFVVTPLIPTTANRSVLPLCSFGIAAKDTDGDGTVEIAVACSTTDDYQLHVLHYSNGALSRYGEKVTVETFPSDGQVNMAVDAAIGDFDGDCSEEIAVFYVKMGNDGVYAIAGVPYIAMYKCRDNAITTLFKRATSIDIDAFDHLPYRVVCEAADMDNDGRDELISLYNKDRHAYVSVRKWSSGLSNAGSVVTSDVRDLVGDYWALDGYSSEVALAVGSFKCTVNNTPQIALAYMASDSHVDQLIVEYVNDGTEQRLVLKSKAYLENIAGAYDDHKHLHGLTLTAADYDHQSMILGEPTVLTVTDKIQPTIELQAPPKHYDVVDGKVIDIFSKAGSKLSGEGGYYSTSITTTGSTSETSSVTDSSNMSFGMSVAAEGGLSGLTKKNVPVGMSASGGFSFAHEKASSNTKSHVYSEKNTISSTVTYDDMVSFQTYETTIYRYPVLYPIFWDGARGSVKKISGDVIGSSADVDEEQGNAFLQIIVPEKPYSMYCDGTDVDWYSPRHQMFSLFSYPRNQEEFSGYVNSQAYANDGSRIRIGSSGSLSSTTTLTQVAEKINTQKVTQKVGVNAKLGASVGNLKKTTGSAKGSVSFGLDFAWTDSSTASSNISDCGSFYANWPGRNAYTNNGELLYTDFEDMEFDLQTATIVEDNGNLMMGHMIKSLKNENSAYWKSSGPYGTKPDPALNLPNRLNYVTYEYVEPSGDANLRARLLRGFDILNPDVAGDPGMEVRAGTSNFRAVDVNDTYVIHVCVYNYSFKQADGVSAELHWTTNATDPLSDATKVTNSDGVVTINGWTPDGEENMKKVIFNWDPRGRASEVAAAPGGVVSGYLHVRLVTTGEEIHTDNNWGYVPMSLYDGGVINTDDNAVSLEVVKDSLKMVDAQGKAVTSTAVAGDCYVEAKIKVTSRHAVPDVRVMLLSREGKGKNRLIAGRAFSAMKASAETEDGITTVRVPLKYAYALKSQGLTVKVASPFLKKTVTYPPESTTGGGGCGAGVSGLLAVLPLLLLGNKRAFKK